MSLGQAMRALSESRVLYTMQSHMTVFGTPPTIRQVREVFSERLAQSVGILESHIQDKPKDRK